MLTESNEVELNRLYYYVHPRSISSCSIRFPSLTVMDTGLHFEYGPCLWDIHVITLKPPIVRVRNPFVTDAFEA